jgi:putrescine transport system ATP-binding protein
LELVGIIQQVGVTCVMVTHDQEEAMTMATRIGVMSEGRILQVGRPDRNLRNPELPVCGRLYWQCESVQRPITVESGRHDHVVIGSS